MSMESNIKERLAADEQAEAAELAAIAEAEKAQEQAETPPAEPAAPETAQEPAQEPATPPPEPSRQVDDAAALKAEIDRLKADNERLNARWQTADGILKKRESDRDLQLQELKGELAAIKLAQKEPPKPKEKPYLKLLSPEEQEALKEQGQEPLEYRMAKAEIDAAREEILAAARAEADAKLAELERKSVEKLEAEKAQAQADAAFDTLIANVDKLAPGFKKDNATSGSNWTKFLAMTDPATGRTYRDVAERFASIEYADGIANLYKTFQAMDPSGSAAQALEGQLKPSTVKATQAPKPVVAPFHTRAEYDAYYTNKRHGVLPTGKDGKTMTKDQVASYEVELEDWAFKQQLGGG